MVMNKSEVMNYGKCWTFVVEENGAVTAYLRLQGRRGATLFYRNWTEALQDIAPVSWTHVFVEVAK